MGKIAAVFMTGVLCLGLLAGCSGSSNAPTDSSSSEAASGQTSSVSSASSASDESASSSGAAGKVAKRQSRASSVPAALKSQVKKDIAATSVEASFAYVDLESGASYFIDGYGNSDGDAPMVSASVIKLLILAAFLDQVDQGDLDFDTVYTLQSSDIVGGTGSLQSRGAGAQVTLREAARLMITESDNVAANILIDQMGMKYINAEAEKLGLTSTQLNRRMMEDNGRQNYMSARDAAVILKKIYQGTLVSKKMSALALEFLKGQTDDTGFAQGLSGQVTFAHKTGTLSSPSVQNDAGIVLADHPYILVCFTAGSQQAGSVLMTELAESVQANR
ncbi:MAG: serine hydrolase [Eggerthellaceae bacterium]|jgi:beta-lactamase class A